MQRPAPPSAPRGKSWNLHRATVLDIPGSCMTVRPYNIQRDTQAQDCEGHFPPHLRVLHCREPRLPQAHGDQSRADLLVDQATNLWWNPNEMRYQKLIGYLCKECEAVGTEAGNTPVFGPSSPVLLLTVKGEHLSKIRSSSQI